MIVWQGKDTLTYRVQRAEQQERQAEPVDLHMGVVVVVVGTVADRKVAEVDKEEHKDP